MSFLRILSNFLWIYNKRPIKSHLDWIDKIPESIKEYLSEKHCKNGLVESSWKNELIKIKDFWELPTDSQWVAKAIFELAPWKDCANVQWTKDNLELSKLQFEELSNTILDILSKY